MTISFVATRVCCISQTAFSETYISEPRRMQSFVDPILWSSFSNNLNCSRVSKNLSHCHLVHTFVHPLYCIRICDGHGNWATMSYTKTHGATFLPFEHGFCCPFWRFHSDSLQFLLLYFFGFKFAVHWPYEARFLKRWLLVIVQLYSMFAFSDHSMVLPTWNWSS